ncbi:hypothetical protein E2562_023390 [Oryza meyeriana var. granulata]|uniref:Uncharacterized protein n=1 Tax=Oryza meyeriana var. granulata TaxID=110450 RepID=A0A6G1E0L7_9ORYZ|nr:hypothetical protein E2562_023390 [Oryza meyeriana var. granulata]
MMQADNNNLEIGAAEAQDAGKELGSLTKRIKGVGLATLVMSVSTLVNEPAHGWFFEHHAVAYYLTLMGIFIAGVVEVWTAFWLSGGAQAGHGRRAFGAAVFWASVVPLAAVAGIGGYIVLANVLN